MATSPRTATGAPRPPAVRLAPRDELAAAARVAPLLRAARDLARWAADRDRLVVREGQRVPALSAADAAAAAADLDLTHDELSAAWQVATGARILNQASSGDILASGDPDAVLTLWDEALGVMMRTTELEGLMTALYTVGGPVRIDALFEAYEAARQQVPPGDSAQAVRQAGPPSDPAEATRQQVPPGGPAARGGGGDVRPHTAMSPQSAATSPGAAVPPEGVVPSQGAVSSRAGLVSPPIAAVPSHAAASSPTASLDTGRTTADVVGLSAALETLADLGVVDLGSDEDAGVLTVALSRLGTWGVYGRLRARGWQLPVAGQLAQDRAAVLLAALADYDAEQGEAEIAAWLALRGPADAAAELMEAASQGSPGLRGAAFAVLDRVGEDAIAAVRGALADPVLRPHAVVWLRDHGEQADFCRGDQEWLLVDLGAGLLEEAEPEDVVAELLPDLPSGGQAKLVAGLWEVAHPGLIGLLTALGSHHHDPAVAKAARKAAFKARSRAAAEAHSDRSGHTLDA